MNSALVDRCGRRVFEATRAHCTADKMARQHRELYERVMGIPPPC